MRAKLAPELQLTIEEFLAFTASRPDEERWELIEGVPVRNASPVDYHQQIVGNIYRILWSLRETIDAPWWPLLGIGTRVPGSPNSLPQPDVMVLPRPNTGTPTPVAEDALILFEVLSPSNTAADQAWRKRVYASIPNCQHYVTVSQKAFHVTRFDRATGWKALDGKTPGEKLELPALGKKAIIPLAEIYRWTPLGRR
jgi:Uma2 family endonuclease